LKARNNQADDRLLVEAAQRDPDRFAELYELHFERVYAFIARHARGREVAQDLTSEVFHDALASIRRFEWRGVPFSAWLLRIASNALADHFGRLARSQKTSAPPGMDVENVVAFNSTFEEVDERARLFRLVKTLPPDQRRVVEMRFGEERSIRDISREIGRSEGAVKQLQFRALESLRAEVGTKEQRKPLGRLRRKSGGRNG
jgi:RNA polymerase sigma-70 factor (ECF subfamily)